jgi:hypothetical protein
MMRHAMALIFISLDTRSAAAPTVRTTLAPESNFT